MIEIFQMLFLGFVIGLTGALAPGPTLVATINASIAGDWTIRVESVSWPCNRRTFSRSPDTHGNGDSCTSLRVSDCRAWRDSAYCIRYTDNRRKQEGKHENYFHPNGCQPLYCRIYYECSKPVLLDLVALNRERNGTCRAPGGTGACRSPYDRALVCRYPVVNAGLDKRIQGQDDYF